MSRRRGTLGEIGRAALQLAAVREVTYLDLHRDLLLSRRDASVTINNLRTRGHLEHVGDVCLLPRGTAPRPVPVVVAARPPATVEERLAALTMWSPAAKVRA